MSERNRALDVDRAVRDRYSVAAQEKEPALCCPVNYDTKYLDILPAEILERDYGCGDPSKHVAEGETVLDLGSGGGKICYISSQIVGSRGRVIGVDMNDDMLALARKYQQQIGDRLGYHNTTFHKGRIQDLALDLDRFKAYLEANPICHSDDWIRAEAFADELRRTEPTIPDDSVDCIVSNCVLNLVAEADRLAMFREMFRVLKRGGRVVISDIASDEPVPDRLKSDAELWSGCISGAFVEEELLATFEAVGFHGIEILARGEKPWATVDGIEFTSVTVRAYKGKQGPCLDRAQAILYKGPWKSVTDDDGHVLQRGQRMAVCEKTFQIYTRPPYADQVIPIPPNEEVPAENAAEFDCRRNEIRNPRETKGRNFDVTQISDSNGCCGPQRECG